MITRVVILGGSWRPWLVALLIYAVGIGAYVSWRAERSTDFRDYWRTALHWRQTGELSAELGVHNYLPCFTILMTPWSYLPLQVAIVLFVWLSLAALAVVAVLCERLVRDVVSRAAVQLALLLVAPYIHSCCVLGAVDLLVLALVVAFINAVLRRRDAWAGAALGLAIAIKVIPALLLLYLLLVRRWRALSATILTIGLVAGALPLAVLGPDRLRGELARYREVALLEHSAKATIFADQPRKAIYTNNALPIVLRRLLTPLNANPGDERVPFFVNIADWPRQSIWATYLIAGGAIMLLCALATIRHRRRQQDDDPLRTAWALAAWCCAMILLSPLVWTRYLLLATWPLVLIADVAIGGRGATPRTTEGNPRELNSLVIASRLVLALWGLGVASLAWPAARAAGSLLFCVLAVWGLCVFVCLIDFRTGGHRIPADTSR
ncbi:MAG: glycosyltransferase 87 family protein [Phycisphaerae bacterium]